MNSRNSSHGRPNYGMNASAGGGAMAWVSCSPSPAARYAARYTVRENMRPYTKVPSLRGTFPSAGLIQLVSLTLMVLAPFVSIVSAAHPSIPAPIQESDISTGRVRSGMSTTDVRDLLGDPLRATPYPDPIGGDIQLQEWEYSGLLIAFVNDTVTGFSLSSRRHRTSRGLRAGDPVSRASKLYGQPNKVSGNLWTFLEPAQEFPLAVKVESSAGKVVRITLGLTFDLPWVSF